MSKQAERILASAASLADLENEFRTPAPKDYPSVKPPANTPPSATAKPLLITPPLVEAPVVEAQPVPAPTEVVPRPQSSVEPAAPVVDPAAARRRVGKGAARAAAAQKLPPSRVGKVPINVWTTEEKRRALKVHAASEGTTVDELMTEGLDDLIKKRRIRVG